MPKIDIREELVPLLSISNLEDGPEEVSEEFLEFYQNTVTPYYKLQLMLRNRFKALEKR